MLNAWAISEMRGNGKIQREREGWKEREYEDGETDRQRERERMRE